MAEWKNNNRACTTLWTSLFRMQQLFTNFDDSGDLVMSDLTFFNILDSAQLREQNALMVADELDIIFFARGAEYESDVDRAMAIDSMVQVLTDEEKMVKELAEVIDQSYLFWKEPINN